MAIKWGSKAKTLKTGAYSLRELAMAIKWGSKANIDLLTIDGSGGGTGMSPWRMMDDGRMGYARYLPPFCGL